MSCSQYEKFLYLYKEGELDTREQQILSVHLEQCEHCRTALEQLHHLGEPMGVLQSNPPGLSHPNRLTNHIMREVQGYHRPDEHLSGAGRFEQFIEWLGTARVRFALIATAVVIVLLFATQEMMILSRLSNLERKIDTTNRSTTAVFSSGRLESVIDKLLADAPERTGDSRITLSRERLLDLLGEYRQLRSENILLRHLLERRFPELAQSFRQSDISEEDWEVLFRAYGDYLDLLRQL